jgi:hypothetical protein
MRSSELMIQCARPCLHVQAYENEARTIRMMQESYSKGTGPSLRGRINGSIPIPVLATIHLPASELNPARHCTSPVVMSVEAISPCRKSPASADVRASDNCRTRRRPAVQKDLPAVFISAKTPWQTFATFCDPVEGTWLREPRFSKYAGADGPLSSVSPKRRNGVTFAKAGIAPAALVIMKMPTERAAARTVFASFATHAHYSGKLCQSIPVVAAIRDSRDNLTQVPNKPNCIRSVRGKK